MANTLDSLPDKLLSIICGYLSARTVSTLRRVNSMLRRAVPRRNRTWFPLNEDVLSTVCDFLPAKDVSALRLVNLEFKEKVSSTWGRMYFKTLRVIADEGAISITRLATIACMRYRALVQQVHIDMTAVGPEDDLAESLIFHSFIELRYFHRCLLNSLRRFPNCHIVRLSETGFGLVGEFIGKQTIKSRMRWEHRDVLLWHRSLSCNLIRSLRWQVIKAAASENNYVEILHVGDDLLPLQDIQLAIRNDSKHDFRAVGINEFTVELADWTPEEYDDRHQPPQMYNQDAEAAVLRGQLTSWESMAPRYRMVESLLRSFPDLEVLSLNLPTGWRTGLGYPNYMDCTTTYYPPRLKHLKLWAQLGSADVFAGRRYEAVASRMPNLRTLCLERVEFSSVHAFRIVIRALLYHGQLKKVSFIKPWFRNEDLELLPLCFGTDMECGGRRWCKQTELEEQIEREVSRVYTTTNVRADLNLWLERCHIKFHALTADARDCTKALEWVFGVPLTSDVEDWTDGVAGVHAIFNVAYDER